LSVSCRSCTSFADWASQTKKKTKGATTSKDVTAGPPSDCPPDVEQLGRSSWTLLHSIAASYPTTPTPTEQSQVRQFMGLFSKLYPCWVCAEDFQDFMTRNKIRTESRDEFGQWMCEAHNDVNRKLGKKEFDCSRWEERWRTGWKDGRCG
jgi:FAD-linked sulfhydryl oxidase